MKRVRLAPSFRSQRVAEAIVEQIASAVKRGVKVVQYSIQEDHLHLMVEGADKQELARGMKLLFSRIAFAVNRVSGRCGSLFRERHHRRPLTTPTEVRNALVYILFNARKHVIGRRDFRAAFFSFLDDKSSAPWFTGWAPNAAPPQRLVERSRARWPGAPPLHEPTTWLAAHGWRRATPGHIRFDELPRLPD
ncbi:MAG: transposase [Labilithrix sp.]|nr:transposase [Labilithrix sp.]MCW5817999.1 transposase [Labilithrix sp.]